VIATHLYSYQCRLNLLPSLVPISMDGTGLFMQPKQNKYIEHEVPMIIILTQYVCI